MRLIKNRIDLWCLSTMLDQGFFQLLEKELEFLKEGCEINVEFELSDFGITIAMLDSGDLTISKYVELQFGN